MGEHFFQVVEYTIFFIFMKFVKQTNCKQQTFYCVTTNYYTYATIKTTILYNTGAPLTGENYKLLETKCWIINHFMARYRSVTAAAIML